MLLEPLGRLMTAPVGREGPWGPVGKQEIAGRSVVDPSAHAVRGGKSVRHTVSDVDARQGDMELGGSDGGATAAERKAVQVVVDSRRAGG